jgi:hypothetical protein
MTMAGLAAIQFVAPPRRIDTDVVLRIATAAFALVLIPLEARPLVVLILLAGAMVAQVVYELLRHEAHAHGMPG